MENESIHKSSGSNDHRAASWDDLTGLEGILHHILRMTKQHIIILDIKVDNKPKTYKSIFMGVTSEGKTEGLLINQLIPADGNSLIKKSKKVTVSYYLEGVNFTFDSWFLEIHKAIPLSSFKLEIPTLIRKIQRRKAARVSPLSTLPLKVDLGDRIAKKVYDISIGGLCFITHRNNGEFQKEKTFSNISFALPLNNCKICTKAEVRWFVENAITGHQARNKCGIEFIAMKPADEDAIGKYVSERQRDIIRNTQRIYY